MSEDAEQSSTDPMDPIQVFVASPIGSAGTPEHRKALLVLDYVIRKALPQPKWNVLRADDEYSPDSITQKVIRRILDSNLVVVDLTDHNPNVFYELAIAHCYGKPVVQIAASKTPIPFDVTDQRTIFYDLADPSSVDTAKATLEQAARHAIENPKDLVTPLSAVEAIQLSTAKIEAGDTSELSSVMETILARLNQIERRLESPQLIDPLASRFKDPAEGTGGGKGVLISEMATAAGILSTRWHRSLGGHWDVDFADGATVAQADEFVASVRGIGFVELARTGTISDSGSGIERVRRVSLGEA